MRDKVNNKQKTVIKFYKDGKNKTIANLLTQMDQNSMPVALGVIYCIEKPTLDSYYSEKINNHNNDISKIMEKGQTWTI